MKHGGGIVTVSVGSAALGSGRLAVFDGITNSALCQSWWKCLAMSLCYKAQTHLGYGAGQWSKIHQQGHLWLAQKKNPCVVLNLSVSRSFVLKKKKSKEESPKIQIFLRLPHTVSELFHSVPCLVCTGVFPFPGWYCVLISVTGFILVFEHLGMLLLLHSNDIITQLFPLICLCETILTCQRQQDVSLIKANLAMWG